jgi:hypothetical protein
MPDPRISQLSSDLTERNACCVGCDRYMNEFETELARARSADLDLGAVFCGACRDGAVIADLLAEVARLRGALERIARAGEGVPSWRAMVDVAREALNGGEDG